MVDIITAERKKARLEGVVAMFYATGKMHDVATLAKVLPEQDFKQFEELYIEHVMNDVAWVRGACARMHESDSRGAQRGL